MRKGKGKGMALRRAQMLDTASRKLKFELVLVGPGYSVSNRVKSVRWSKSRTGTSFQRDLHLLDKMLVATEARVGRKERTWMRRQSGRLLITSL